MSVVDMTKKEIVAKFGKTPEDTGRTEVQVALLTKRITGLMPHFNANKHDFASKRGLMQMVGKRRSLLKYLQSRDQGRYQAVIKELNLRK